MAISEVILPEYDREMANTRKLLELVPDGKFDYRPHAKSMELGRLASHIAEFPSWAKNTLETEVLNLTPDQKPYLASSRTELLNKFDSDVKEARELLAKTSDAEFQKTWTMNWGGKTIMSMPRVAVMRGVIMNHMIHHRAQLGVYLRLNEIEFPGMYGPSADEMKFWEQPKSEATNA